MEEGTNFSCILPAWMLYFKQSLQYFNYNDERLWSNRGKICTFRYSIINVIITFKIF